MYLEIGQVRQFHRLPEKQYIIRKIFQDSQLTMEWVWDRGMCPHCNTRIQEAVAHLLTRIEILSDIKKSDEEITLADVKTFAYTADGKYMLLDNKTKKKVLELCSIPKIRELHKEI